VSEVIFWTAVGAIVYAYGGYSLVTMLLALLVRNPVKRADITPSVTLLITAYNEELDIAQKLEGSLKLDYPRELLEIIVASDGSTDRTDEIVRGFEARGVKLVRVEGRLGKTGTQNEAVKHARGEIIVFSDATTTYDSQALRKLVRNYADPRIGAVSGRYEYRNPSGAPIGLGTVLFWKYENAIKSMQTRIWTITGCCGCIYSVRRSAYVPLPRDIISDLCQPLKILESGYRIAFEREAVAYEDALEESKGEFSMRVRVISRGMHGLIFMRKLLNPLRKPFVAFQLISHKWMRWLVPVFAAVALLANAALLGENIFYDVTFALQLAFYSIALLAFLLEGRVRFPKLLGVPLYFVTVNLASVSAMRRVFKGIRATTWETVRAPQNK
jgi:cellulose synthase/poly-beta-1,6-N-acetylglucosamine synthase-like glycosyltransferase